MHTYRRILIFFVILSLSSVNAAPANNPINDRVITQDKDKIQRDIEQLKKDKVILQADRDRLKEVNKSLEYDKEAMVKDLHQLDVDRVDLERDSFISKSTKENSSAGH